MPLGIYVLERSGRTVKYLTDDRAASFMHTCASAPPDSLLSGVMRHGDTMFNRAQLLTLIEDLEALEVEGAAVVSEILNAARLARDKSLYLFIRGDY